MSADEPMVGPARHEIVATSDRPELARITARWRWEAFARKHGRSFADVLRVEQDAAAAAALLPRTLVLFENRAPIGMASLIEHDLDDRLELTPWLAGVFVTPEARRCGKAALLISGIEQVARERSIGTIWLYTRNAERIYARAGWRTVETFERKDNMYALMRRDLRPAPDGADAAG